MTVVCIAHPLGDDPQTNLEKIKIIARQLNQARQDIIPIAPSFLDWQALDMNDPAQNERMVQNTLELIKSRKVDELWLYGERISAGMAKQIAMAKMVGVKVIPQSIQILHKLNAEKDGSAS